MSQKFENIFKEALQNQEVPFDAAAWDALSSRLDKAMPVSVKKPFGPKAASIIAVGLIGAASIWYFATSNNSPEERKINTVQSEKTQSIENQTISKENKEQTTVQSNKIGQNETNTDEKNKSLTDKTTAHNVLKHTKQSTGSSNGNYISSPSEGNFIADKSELVLPKKSVYANPEASSVNSSLNIDLPFIATSCQYEDTKITNTSDVLINLQFPSGKAISIKPKQSKTVQLTDAGLYVITNEMGVEKSFIVNENKAVDFIIDTDNKYNNGVPSTEVILSSVVSKANWHSSFGNQSYGGNTTEFHFFKKGTQMINLKATNSKGCVSEATKTISINEDYNLMATTAFMPQDIDPRNNTFMPFALTVRDTKFKMIILDPKEGGLVYETTDASAGWDGIDRRTGKPATHASTYIWKVTLENPLPGESNDYKGTVMVTIN